MQLETEKKRRNASLKVKKRKDGNKKMIIWLVTTFLDDMVSLRFDLVTSSKANQKNCEMPTMRLLNHQPIECLYTLSYSCRQVITFFTVLHFHCRFFQTIK